MIDFGTGDPHEPTDPKIRRLSIDGLRDRMGYPAAVGLAELREAIAAWAQRRFGSTLDPDTEIIPTLGSKEAIFSFAQVVVDIERGKDTVAYTEPGYPVYERGALFAHARALALPLLEENGFLPDLDAIDDWTLNRLAVLWVNYPNNPTGATAPLSFYEQAAELARTHGFVLASDEAYTELWFDEPPASALQLDDLTNVAVFNTLSKRSSMTGYRSGFVAGDPELVGGPARVPADGRHCAAGVRPARLGCRLGRRGPRRARARDLRTQAAALPRILRQEGGARDRQCGDDVPLARGPAQRGFRELRRRSRSVCSSTACSSRPAPISEPRAKGTSGWRSFPRRTTAAERSRSSRSSL